MWVRPQQPHLKLAMLMVSRSFCTSGRSQIHITLPHRSCRAHRRYPGPPGHTNRSGSAPAAAVAAAAGGGGCGSCCCCLHFLKCPTQAAHSCFSTARRSFQRMRLPAGPLPDMNSQCSMPSPTAAAQQRRRPPLGVPAAQPPASASTGQLSGPQRCMKEVGGLGDTVGDGVAAAWRMSVGCGGPLPDRPVLCTRRHAAASVRGALHDAPALCSSAQQQH